MSTFLISILLIVYGSFRSLNMEQEAREREKEKEKEKAPGTISQPNTEGLFSFGVYFDLFFVGF